MNTSDRDKQVEAASSGCGIVYAQPPGFIPMMADEMAIIARGNPEIRMLAMYSHAMQALYIARSNGGLIEHWSTEGPILPNEAPQVLEVVRDRLGLEDNQTLIWVRDDMKAPAPDEVN